MPTTATTAMVSHQYPGDAAADIWLLAGQSNMYGAAPRPKTSAPPDPRIQLFTRDEYWIPAQDPLHRIYEGNAPSINWFVKYRGANPEEMVKLRENARLNPGGIGGVGPGLFFAREVVEALDCRLGLIPNATDGSAMTNWDPAGKDQHGDSLYGSMIDRVTTTGCHPKGLLWYQGEAETMDTPRLPTYRATLINLFESVRRDTASPDLPIIFVQISRYTKSVNAELNENWEKARETQRQVAREMKNVYMVSAADLALTDFIHIDYESQRRLGHRLAEVALSKVYDKPGHGTPIDLESVHIYPAAADGSPSTGTPEISVVRLKFTGVSGKLIAKGRPTGFELRYPGHTGQGVDDTAPQPFRIEFDPNDPAAVVLHVKPVLPVPARLVYGGGADPYINITDEKDMSIPAFGPIDLSENGASK